MAFDFKLPDLGEGIREAEILGVKIIEGQVITEDTPLFEVETDKAVVEIPSPVAGKVSKIFVKTGEIVPVGSTLVSIEESSTKGQTDKSGPRFIQEIENTQSSPPDKQASNVNAPEASVSNTEREIIATPATRQLARELKIDIHLVHGSGPGGKISKEDVLAYIESQKAKTTSTPDFQKYGRIERIPIKSIRRKTAQQMALSWSKIPHVTHCDEVNITKLEQFRHRQEQGIKEKSAKLTLTAYLIKAITMALEKYPEFNSSLDEQTEEIILKHYYNIGMAVATDRGLIVPVIRDTNKKSISELAIEVNNIAEKTRSGKIELEQLQGGTFTLTNIGVIGGTGATPIINYPEAAILATMQARKKPIVNDDKIEIGLIMPLSLAFDHRITDGAEAANFVNYIVDLLENPIELESKL